MKYDLPVDYTKLSAKKRKEVRLQYIEEQDNKCYLCESELDQEPPKHVTDLKINLDLFPPFFLSHPIHLQHCHETNMTEGAVHAYCNAVLWQYYGR